MTPGTGHLAVRPFQRPSGAQVIEGAEAVRRPGHQGKVGPGVIGMAVGAGRSTFTRMKSSALTQEPADFPVAGDALTG
jgi:hypothetical protein